MVLFVPPLEKFALLPKRLIKLFALRPPLGDYSQFAKGSGVGSAKRQRPGVKRRYIEDKRVKHRQGKFGWSQLIWSQITPALDGMWQNKLERGGFGGVTGVAFPVSSGIAGMVMPIKDGEWGPRCTSVWAPSKPVAPSETVCGGRRSFKLRAGYCKDVPFGGRFQTPGSEK